MRPNPFNPGTHLDFQLDRRQSIVVEVFEVGGRRVRTLADGQWPAGSHRIEWDGRDDAGPGPES